MAGRWVNCDPTLEFTFAAIIPATAYGVGPNESSSEQRAEAVAWLKKPVAGGRPGAPGFLAKLEAQN